MNEISFDRPIWLVNTYYIIGSLSLILNFLGSYLIIFRSSKIDSFKWFLLWFQLSCTVCDAYGTLIDQPIMMYPMWAAYSAGIVHKFVSARLASTLYNFLIQQEFCALLVCFLRKYRSLKRLENPQFVLSLWKVVIVSQSISLVNAICFYVVSMDKSSAMPIIREMYIHVADGFESLDDFIFWPVRPELIFWLVVYVISMSSCNNVIFYTTRRMTKILKEKSQMMSKVTSRKHKLAIASLIAQCMSAGVMAVPMLIFVLLMVLNVGRLQVMTWLVMTTLLTHSTVNCIVMILTFPPYRKALSFWKNISVKKTEKIQSSSTFAIGEVS